MVRFRAFSLAFFCLAIVVSVFALCSISSGSFNSECFLWCFFEESLVIHHKKNYWLYKDATCHNLWPCDFTDFTAFSSLFFLALHYCFFLYIFFLLWLLLWLLNVYQVLFQGHLSPLNVAFSGCFFGLFCPVLLGGCFLALCRSLISSE